ncbi:hypothetical protein IMSAGC006_02297 [Muribaculaceae bacterium]|nr:hypothetical protein IMSAGC006_02297 [Muribaculaceae bacterium]
MLVIVHHGDIAFGLKPCFDLETLRSLDILKIDAAKRRRDGLYNLYKLFRIFLIHLYVKAIQSCKNFKQQRLSFHHGLSGFGSYVAETEHRRTV